MPEANTDSTAALDTLRQRIDTLDTQLLALLNERASVAEAVGRVKRAEGSPVYRPDREAQVRARLQSLNTGPLPGEAIDTIWREIMSACRSLEAPEKVAYLGPVGTFSQEALIVAFGHAAEGMPCPSFDDVFRSVVSGTADFGVVPLENSTEGVVARTMDLLLAQPVQLLAEVSLPVRHGLLRQHQSLEGIVAVCAHPQALAQCHGWLSTHLPMAERRAVASNAEGARLASTDPSLAGIASAHAAQHYGLMEVAAAIQDDPLNRTRFGVIGPLRPSVALPTHASGALAGAPMRTSVVVSVPNRPGALHDVLVPFKRHGVSMSRFESRPARSGQWEYSFFIDLEGAAHDTSVAASLQELQAVSAFFKLLGSYPVSSRD